ncbi:MAG: hypothetical protein COV07_00040 [Candidatus Vogelbacteria bacterium CG10_big_fil_rev_8_21_14_0_10_45_14]|uniref:Uncharacterized protein n=1 Tax=Candidatus Vogelbacteria bacterium CG10_big_fil_rev_8_21_14_0_10_45_14 TaxID=1975042 RepID=A0A2H0RMK9_9BACT|nr:MAG: hypothetical protein COV07_00040 [Candidatus Vogelbacteria bacterium CG10_big_fil_rev_8_21_14_0_10_45_14]
MSTILQIVFGIFVATLFLSFVFVAINIPLVISLLMAGEIWLVLTMLPSLFLVDFSPIVFVINVVNALLFGFIITLIVARRLKRGSLGAGVALAIGSGCGACGLGVMSALLVYLGMGWIFAILPLAGGEFALLGTLILLFVAHRILKEYRNGSTCSSA